MKKQRIQLYLLSLLLAIIIAVSANAVDINDVDCDEIIQCDAYGSEWDSGHRVCVNAEQDTPYTEEVHVATIRFADYCNSTDTSSDCIDISLDFYETTSDGTYAGDGWGRFGGVTKCCTFGETTVSSYGLINDFQPDTTITRRWSIIDEDDTAYDSCPTDTYNPIDITQTTDLDTFNISFLPFNRYYDQYSEPGFDQSTAWGILDYFANSESTTRSRYDEIKTGLQEETGNWTSDWDPFNIFSFADYSEVDDYLDSELPTDCDSYEIRCTNPVSTSSLCTANTGVNVMADTEGFLEAFFEKYKTPIGMQLSHEWCYGETLSNCFRGYYYWELAYGIKDSDVLTYQGSRQFTKRTITRIEDDWEINDFEGVYITCSGGSNSELEIKYDSKFSGIYSLSEEDLGNGNQFILIKDEHYPLYPNNAEESDFTTSDDLVRYDWTDNGIFDTDWEEITDVEGDLFDTSSTTSLEDIEVQVWGKGGKHSITKQYRVYDPFVNPDIELISSSWSTYFGDGEIEFTPFGSSYSDLDKIDYFCIDWEDDGDFDVLWSYGAVTFNCPGITAGEEFSASSYAHLISQDFTIDYGVYALNGAGSYDMRIRYGMDLKYATDYARDSVASYVITTPDANAEFKLNAGYSWNPTLLEDIIFDLDASIFENDIDCLCLDYNHSSGYDICIADNHATDNECVTECSLVSCTVLSTPERYDFNITYSDFNTLDALQMKARVFDDFGTNGIEYQAFQFRFPDNDVNIKYEYQTGGFVGYVPQINLNETIVYSINDSVVENEKYVCYDYSTDGIYDICYSNAVSDNQCGLSCVYVADIKEGLLNVSYGKVGKVGSLTLTAFLYNNYTNSTDSVDYIISDQNVTSMINPVIVSTLEDDDINDDFVINYKDWNNLKADLPENKTWYFEFSAVNSDIIGGLSVINFTCWDEYDDGIYDKCYGQEIICFQYCGINTSSENIFTTFIVNQSGKDNKIVYTVKLLIGSVNKNLFGYSKAEYWFNPPTQKDVNAMRFFIVLIVLFVYILFGIVGLFLVGFVIIIIVIFAIVYRLLKRDNRKNKNIYKDS